MATFACPSCGAELVFRSSVTITAVCTSCGSMVVRTDLKLEAIGKVASLPEDVTPLQVGTSLLWQGRNYTLLGRARMAWDDGAWNEWFADDGRTPGWLADAQGFLSLAFEQELPPDLAAALPALGDLVPLAGQTYRVIDVKQAVCVGSEGELPFAAPKGRTATYYDMLGPNAGFAGIEDGDGERRLYLGTTIPFDALRFSGLRAIEGWQAPQAGTAHDGDPRYADRPR